MEEKQGKEIVESMLCAFLKTYYLTICLEWQEETRKMPVRAVSISHAAVVLTHCSQ
jgi:hypothetical protein